MAMASTNEAPRSWRFGVVQYELSGHGNLPFRFSKWIKKAESPPPVEFTCELRLQREPRTRKCRGRRAVHHRVHVLDADP